jgi:tetratricopeptide (TPR) repeat protein
LTDKEREVLRDQAIADLSEAIRLRAAFADAYTLRAAHTPDQDQAISDLTKLIALSPETADLYVKRESLCAKKGDYQKAAGDFTEAIKRGSDTAALRRQRAEAYVKTRDFAGALADYRKLGEKMSLNCAAEAISLRAEPAEGKVTATASRPPGLIVEDVRGEWLYVRPMFNESKGWVHQKEVR